MQVSSERLKRAMKWVGAALAAAGVGLVMASLGYAGCGVFLALIWWLALRAAGFRSASFSRASSAFLSSQLGKYLPGNVGHFAARHVLSRRHGASHRALVGATLLEALLLVAAAGALAVMVFQPIISGGLGPMMEAAWLAPVVVAFVLGLGLALARRKGWLDSELGLPRLVVELGTAFGMALAFFLASSGCFVLMSGSLGLGAWLPLVPWIAAAWLLGFVVPGAPGGLGIREFVLVLGLTPLIGEAQAALDALLFRLVTISGDALMSAIGSAWLRKQSTGPTGR